MIANSAKARGRALFIQFQTYLHECGAAIIQHKILFHLLALSLFINILSLALPLAMLQTYDRILPNSSTKTLFLLVLLVMASALIEGCLRILRASMTTWTIIRQDYLTNVHIAERLMKAKLSAQRATSQEPGMVLIDFITKSRGQADEQVVVHLLDAGFVLLYLTLLAYIGGVLVFVTVFFMSVLIYQFFKKDSVVTHQLSERKHSAHAYLSFLIDMLRGVYTMKAFSLESLMLRRSETILLKRARTNYHLNRYNMRFLTLTQLLSQVILFGTVGFGAILVMNGQLTIGGLVACTLLSGRCLQPISQILSMWRARFETHYTDQFIKRIQALEPEHSFAQDELLTIEGQITFSNMTFSKSSIIQIHPFSLTIKPNTCVTIRNHDLRTYYLFYILMKFIEPTGGSVKIDGRPIQEYANHSLRKYLGYVPHRPHVFQATIMDNLTQFRPEKEAYAKRLIHELEIEYLFQAFPDGYSTKIGPNANHMFSEGLRLIITFLRVLIDEPKILMLNHITMFADFRSRSTLIKIASYVKNKMTLFIATEDIALLKLGDQTLEFDGGRFKKVKHD